MSKKLSFALIASLLLAACGGGSPSGNSLTPNSPGGGGTSPQAAEQNYAVATANAVGGSVRAFAKFEGSQGPPISIPATTSASSLHVNASSACTNNVTFSVPDLRGDPNSTEQRSFYDGACAHVARDYVRQFSAGPGAGSEIVDTTEKQFAYSVAGTGPLTAQRDDITIFTSSAFDKLGYPSRSAGYVRTSSGFLDIGSTKTIISDYGLVMQPANGSSNAFCSDQAGFNAVGVSGTTTFGWQGVVAGGTRTVNGDGSVRWVATHQGSSSTAPIGGLSIALGSVNTTCPIVSPTYTLSGGTTVGNHSIPVDATFKSGLLTKLTIKNAHLSGGLTLNVQTDTSVQPQDTRFLGGTITGSGGTIAVFNVDAYGDGTLTVSVTGNQFPITDWHVRTN